MKLVSASEAISAIPDGSTVVVPASCAEAQGFGEAFAAQVEQFSNLTICSGLSLGNYAFLKRGLGEHFHYLTWQASPSLRSLVREKNPGKFSFVPLRLSDLPAVVRRGGAIAPSVAVVHTSLPQPDGTVNLGISAGPNKHFAANADLVIAQLNPRMPATCGDTRISLDDIDLAFESEHPLATYETGAATAADVQIVDYVLSLIPDNAWVQLGIGAVPDRILAGLVGVPGVQLFSGMLSKSLTTFLEGVSHQPTVINGELAGDVDLYNYCAGNTAIDMQPMTVYSISRPVSEPIAAR